jgi:membrane-bound metal-dependent hydrolase YbcI (DUF457 family)
MANRRTHAVIGTVAGGGAAILGAKNESPLAAVVEFAGGLWGGNLGGRAPDILEPAICPRHRSLAHSWAAVFATVGVALGEAQAKCRTWAAECAAKSQDPTRSPLEQLFFALAELFWRFVAGALVGFRAGYVSHLALDCQTPASLPLLGI